MAMAGRPSCAVSHAHLCHHVGMRVLLVEDHDVLADTIATGLRREGMAVDVSLDGRHAIEATSEHLYDVVVLDRDLPLVHGDDVCRHISSEHPGTRILMLTASDLISDRVHGLSIGADDYLSKPFAFDELVARVRALGRRSRVAAPPTLTRGGLTLDTGRHVVERDGTTIELTRKEFSLLEELMRANGAVVSHEELLERVWDASIDPLTNAIRVTMMTLRRKLGEPAVIETVLGAGYRL